MLIFCVRGTSPRRWRVKEMSALQPERPPPPPPPPPKGALISASAVPPATTVEESGKGVYLPFTNPPPPPPPNPSTLPTKKGPRSKFKPRVALQANIPCRVELISRGESSKVIVLPTAIASLLVFDEGGAFNYADLT